MRNTILARNIDNTGGSPNCGSNTITSAGYNILGDNTGCGGFVSTIGDQIGTGASPIDPLFGRLRNNGGPTETHAISVTSPAIDNGNPATPGSGGNACAAADQLGQFRPFDGDSDTGERCDIGAYERQGAIEEPCSPPIGGDCLDFRFTVMLDVDIDPTCPAAGDLRAERGPTGNDDADGFDDTAIEVIYMDGYVECPGDFFLGSSIPNEGIIEEQVNNQPGVLEFPANGTFTVCLTVASHPFGDLHNCPDSFLPQNKDPLVFSCKIFSLTEFDCTIVGNSLFYDDSDTLVADVQDGSAEIVNDTDRDGCTDAAEQQAGAGSEASGGKRDHENFWDFFDTPDPNTNDRDRSVAGTDFFRILGRFGATGSAAIDPLSAPAAPPAYHTAYDRGAASGDPWDLTAANGSIAGTDFFAILAQFGHDCA
jgi:hypothetical protein